MESENHNEGTNVSPWEPTRFLRTAAPSEVKLSRGFLRCRPEKWFPGFAAQWLPLGHSLGVEMKMIEAKPVLHTPIEQSIGFVGTIDGEPIGLSIDPASARVVTEAIVPGGLRGGDSQSGGLVLEYLARRLLTSLAAAWTGPQSSQVRFEPEIGFQEVDPGGDVRINFSVNGTPAQVVISLGRFLVDRLDSLWRRQVHSTGRAVEAGSEIALEIAQLAVPPSMLGDYLRSGTLIDLESRASDALTLRAGTKAWHSARGCISNGCYAFEVIPGGSAPPGLPEGTTRLSISLGSTRLDGGVVAELAQPGAMWETTVPATDRVELLINGEAVGEGRLGLYEGRFAVTVA
jgi:hypothetical protein